MSAINYDVQWNNHAYQMVNSMANLLCQGQLTDCSLIAEGKVLRAHRFVLAAASPYFLNIFNSVADDELEGEPNLCILENVRYKDLFNVLKFIYTGKVTLDDDDFIKFVNVGNMLHVNGIIGFKIDIGDDKTKAQDAKLVEDQKVIKQMPAPIDQTQRDGTSKGIKRAHDVEFGPQKLSKRRYRECRNSIVYYPDEVMCKFCSKPFYNKSTLNNHERFCEKNPNRKLSTCPICNAIVKPGSMTFHKKSVHGYIPKSRKRQSTSVTPKVEPEVSPSDSDNTSAAESTSHDPIVN